MNNKSMLIFWIAMIVIYLGWNKARISFRLTGGKDMSGWDGMTVSRNAEGDVISFGRVKDDLGFANLSDINAVRQNCRKIAEYRNSGLVEANVVTSLHGPKLMFIYKRLYGTAFIFTGKLIEFLKDESLIWTVIAGERGITGIREAVVTAQLFEEGKLTIESYEKSWANDPYDPAYSSVDKTILHYLSDEEIYDDLFSDHPLSKVRRELKKLMLTSKGTFNVVEPF